jgi:hypothetical protein
VDHLRFGDFDGDGKTDVFGVEAGRWRIVSGGKGPWSDPPLNNQWMTDSVDGLVVDFDGDGIPDVAKATIFGTVFSSGGTGPWNPLRNGYGEYVSFSQVAAPGHFSWLFTGLLPQAQVVMFGPNRRLNIMSLAFKTHPFGCCDLR